MPGLTDAMIKRAMKEVEKIRTQRTLTMARADERARALAPIIAEIRASGITTPYAIAAALTQRGVPTARGHRFWLTSQVRSILKRLERLAGR